MTKKKMPPGFHSPVMQKTNTTVFDSMDGGGLNPRPQGYKPPGGGVKSDSIREWAGPAPGIASFREETGPKMSASLTSPHETQKSQRQPRLFISFNCSGVFAVPNLNHFYLAYSFSRERHGTHCVTLCYLTSLHSDENHMGPQKTDPEAN